MPAPYNYSLGNIPNPADTFLQGMQQGQAQQQADALRMQQQQQMQAQQAMQSELAAAASDPRKIPGLMVRYPQLAEKLKVGLDAMSADEQRGQLQHGAEVASALASGRTDVAIKALRTRAEALRASGDEQGAKTSEDYATWAENDPTSLLSAAIGWMNAIPGGDKVSDGILKLFDEKRKAELQPAAVAKAGAEATTAGVKAKYAESEAVMDLEKKGWDIRKVQADMAYQKESNRIAAMNAELAKKKDAREAEELKLKIADAVKARDAKVLERVAEAESAKASIDNLIDTADQLLNTASEVKRAAMGPVDSRLPTVQQDVADFEETVATLGSQVFLAKAPEMKGLGALAEAEGLRLERSLKSLSLRQSPEQFDANLREVQRLSLKARANLLKKYGMPQTAPDTPSAATPEAVDAALRKYGNPQRGQ